MPVFAVDIGQEFKFGTGGIESVFPTLGKLVSVLLPNIYVLAGLLLFGLLIFGGFAIIMGAGEENPERAKKGKQAITAALIGFLIIFASWWIIQMAEVLTGIDILGGGGL